MATTVYGTDSAAAAGRYGWVADGGMPPISDTSSGSVVSEANLGKISDGFQDAADATLKNVEKVTAMTTKFDQQVPDFNAAFAAKGLA